METLAALTDSLSQYGPHSYVIMWLLLMACGLGFPMPEDVILISGGILAGRGVCRYSLTNIACFAGVLMGDGFVFLLGRYFGPRIKKTWPFSSIFKEKTNARVTEIFEKYGTKVVFMARFMPGLRMPIFLTTGLYQVKPWKFFLLDGAAALISVPLWIWAGFIFGENLEMLERRIKQLQLGLFILIGLFAVLIFSYVMVKRRLLRKNSVV